MGQGRPTLRQLWRRPLFLRLSNLRGVEATEGCYAAAVFDPGHHESAVDVLGEGECIVVLNASH
jgi:hypothetical protein